MYRPRDISDDEGATAAVAALQSWLIKKDIIRWAEDHPGVERPSRTLKQMLPTGGLEPPKMLARISERHGAIKHLFCTG